MGERRRAERVGLVRGLGGAVALVGVGEWELGCRWRWGYMVAGGVPVVFMGGGIVGRFRIGGRGRGGGGGGLRIERGVDGDFVVGVERGVDGGFGVTPDFDGLGIEGGITIVVIPHSALIVGVGEWFRRASLASLSLRMSAGSWYPPSLGVLLISEETLLSAKGLRRSATLRRLERGEW